MQRAPRYSEIDLKKLVDEAMHENLHIDWGGKRWALIFEGPNACIMSTEYIGRPVYAALYRNPPSGIDDGFWTVHNVYLDNDNGLEPTFKTPFKPGNKLTANLNYGIDSKYRKLASGTYVPDGRMGRGRRGAREAGDMLVSSIYADSCIGHWSRIKPLLDGGGKYNFVPDLDYCSADTHKILYVLPRPGNLIVPSELLAEIEAKETK